MVDQRRELHFLVPDADRRRVLTCGDGLPVRTVELGRGETTVAAAAAAASDVVGERLPIVEVHFDYDRDPDAGPVPTLVVTESRPSGPLPGGLSWQDLSDPNPATPAGIAPRLGELLTEWRTGAEPPPLRPRWGRPGWHARATGWLTGCLTALGRPPTGPVEQIRHWGISAIMRIPTASGLVWFKAVFPPFHHEPAVTRMLARSFPDALPTVLAMEPAEGWLLVEDLGPETLDAADDATRRLAITKLVGMQLSMAGRTAELRALGCPDRPLASLADAVASLLGEAPALPGVSLVGAEAVELVERIRAAVERVTDLGLADTLVHGDFHPGNVAAAGGRAVIYDWSDAAISNPLVDFVTWPSHEQEPAVRDQAWRAYRDAWASHLDAAALDARREDVVTVGAAYQAISYADITRNLEPVRRAEMADGIAEFLTIAAGGYDAMRPSG